MTEESAYSADYFEQFAARDEPRRGKPNGAQHSAGAIPEGERNATLYSIGGRLRWAGIEAAALLAALSEVNAKRCRPPLPASEVEAIARSVMRYPPGAGEPAGGQSASEEPPPADDEHAAPGCEPDEANAAAPRRMSWKPMSDIKQEAAEFLSHPRLPRGKIVTLDGFEGCGKTFAALKCCADLSRGRPLFGAPPGEFQDAMVSIYMTAEDGLGDTIKPRLEAMEADMTKVIVLEGPVEGEEAEPFSLFDFDLIEGGIVETRAVLFVLDPAFAFLEGKDAAKTKDCRPLLRKLTEIAQRTGCTILLVRHLKKGFEDRANHRSGGCVDWAAAARSMLLLVEDREDREKRVIAHSKSNLAPKGPTLRFEIVGMDVQWRGESPLDADDLLRPRGSQDDEDGAQSAKAEAAEFLRVELADGPLEQKKLEEAAKAAGINWSAVKRAKPDLKVRSKKLGGVGPWVWTLPTPKRSWESRDDD